jgi:DNA-binding NtrC family response regulator
MPSLPASATDTRYSVLLVDDDAAVLETLEAVLASEFDVATCTSGSHALRLLEEAKRFHVVSADFDMPGMNGVQLLQRVSALRYPIGCLLLTGAEEHTPAVGGRSYHVLLKPVDPQRLLRTVLHLARITVMKRFVGSLPGG